MSLYKMLFETPENKMKVGIIGMIMITSVLAGVFYYEAQAIEVVDLAELQGIISKGLSGGRELVQNVIQKDLSGSTNENSETDNIITISEEYPKLVYVNCTLTWADEPTTYFRGTNEPDQFKVKILNPAGDVVADSDFSTSGSVSAGSGILDYSEDEFEENFLGDWNIVVEAGECGDDSAMVPLLGLRTTPDTGNSWSLQYSFTYLTEKE